MKKGDWTVNFLKKAFKSIMIPVVILSISIVISIVASWIYHTTNSHHALFFTYFYQMIINYLPLLVAAIVPLNFCVNRDGIAMISGVLSFIILLSILNPETLEYSQYLMNANNVESFVSLNNIGIGFVCGLLVALTYNRFYRLQLPTWLSFFSGRRSIPIITTFFTICVSIVLYFLWPVIIHFFLIFIRSLKNGNFVSRVLYTAWNQMFFTFSLELPSSISNQMNYYSLLSVLLPTVVFILKYYSHDKNKSYIIFMFIIILCIVLNQEYNLNVLFLMFSPVLWLLNCISIALFIQLPVELRIIFSLLNIPIYYFINQYLFKYSIGTFTVFKMKQELPSKEILQKMIETFGGFENIKRIEASNNKINIYVFDYDFVDIFELKRITGWSALMKEDCYFEIEVDVNPYQLLDILYKLREEEIVSLVI